jgi:hypothetical protein
VIATAACGSDWIEWLLQDPSLHRITLVQIGDQ